MRIEMLFFFHTGDWKFVNTFLRCFVNASLISYVKFFKSRSFIYARKMKKKNLIKKKTRETNNIFLIPRSNDEINIF